MIEMNENIWAPLKSMVTHLEIVIPTRIKIYRKNCEVTSP